MILYFQSRKMSDAEKNGMLAAATAIIQLMDGLEPTPTMEVLISCLGHYITCMGYADATTGQEADPAVSRRQTVQDVTKLLLNIIELHEQAENAPDDTLLDRFLAKGKPS